MNNPWLFPLPKVVDPPTICLQIEIPNDQNHIAAFLGMLERLATWFRWERDDDHTGLAASDVWKLIFADVAQQLFLGGNCPIPAFGSAGADDGSDFMIRQNPDNPCLLESSVNGIDWCVFADISKCMNFGSQPGTTNDQPQPGGGTQQTCKKLNANGTLLLPVLVSDGDTITLDSADGAGYDGVEFDFGPLWRCPNGDQYVGGLDVGFPNTNPSDPLPSIHHMKLILGLGGSSVAYADLPVGVPVTVTGGASFAQVWVQVNDSTLNDNQGSYDVCVTVKNNQAKNWAVDIDLTSRPGPFLSPLDANGAPWTIWSPGGWRSNGNGPLFGTEYYRLLNLQFNVPTAGVFKTMRLDYTDTTAGDGCDNGGVSIGSTFLFNVACPVTKGTTFIEYDLFNQAYSINDAFAIVFQGAKNNGSLPTGNITLTRFRASGTGDNPFGS